MKRILFPVIVVSVISFSCKKKELKKETTIVSANITADSIKIPQTEELPVDSESMKSDLDYEQVNEKDFGKWKGEYFLDYIDYAGENDGTKLKAKLILDSSEDGHFYLWYEKPNDTVKEGMHHVYGSFGKIGDENNAIKFLPEIISEGEDTGIDLDYFLYSKDGKFYIKSGMIPSENGDSKELPIKKNK
ncbi:hypothetical protein QFZ37_002331 [Chryseobacterium ginsenosidimutans]|uniref:hypothetical protein n=1 Tax=Chryseobacterium ginsenosidimutans TaxID=687846 RepID=UPI002787ABC2|nr:hypothetical protein [Chryseobacterium ginsenosidimutans]MDQ0593962.1 hypothetical protein [Chryseobacterium ginsenosidimutans]